jgi:magnesium and cobalt transporter
MSDDSNGSSPSPKRSWFGRLGQALAGEPRNREELLQDLKEAAAAGLIPEDVLAMIEGAIEVSELKAEDVMVPRAQIVSIPVDASLEEILEIVVESGHSRFPVHGEDRDDILGILLAKDLLRCFRRGAPPCDLRVLIRPVLRIPESKRLDRLLREFREKRSHLAIVVDEYGGVAGLITIEDVLEEIVGEIDDEHDEGEESRQLIVPREDGRRFLVDALTPIDVFNERFGCDFSDEEFDTVGGLVTDALGHLPEVGEEARIGRFLFRVARADQRRVQALEVELAAE